MINQQPVKRYKVQVTGGCAVVLVCINGREQFSADVVVDAEVYDRDIKALLGMLQQWADGYDHTTPIDESLHPLYVETRDALKEARDRE